MTIKESRVSGEVIKINSINRSLLLKVDKDFAPSVVEGGEEYYPNGNKKT